MSPYEILQPGGSIEYTNDEAGAVWMRRMLDVYRKAVWLNPEPRATLALSPVGRRHPRDHGSAHVPDHHRGAGARDALPEQVALGAVSELPKRSLT